MIHEPVLITQRMRTPRAAAIAGIVFSLLLITSMLLIWTSVPADPRGPAADVVSHLKAISFSYNLLPFAGVAFLWFIAVVRDRLGVLEDRFFATVFLGSGLLFIAMMFNVGALAGGLIDTLSSRSGDLIQSGTYSLSRAEIYQTMHTYAMKMAGVFMISTSTISLRTRIFPRWMAMLGYVLALVLLLSLGRMEWFLLVFPLWVFLISVYILIDNFQGRSVAAA
jgi:hypothetical protein